MSNEVNKLLQQKYLGSLQSRISSRKQMYLAANLQAQRSKTTETADIFHGDGQDWSHLLFELVQIPPNKLRISLPNGFKLQSISFKFQLMETFLKYNLISSMPWQSTHTRGFVTYQVRSKQFTIKLFQIISHSEGTFPWQDMN